jgi:hypothetical protein
MQESEFLPEPLEEDAPATETANIDTLRQAWARFSDAYSRVERLQPIARAINGLPNSAPFPLVVAGLTISYMQKTGEPAEAKLANIFNVGDVADLFGKELERLADILVEELGAISSVPAGLQQTCQTAQYVSRMQQNNFLS